MSAYLAIKWLHIISSVLLVGTGFGTAYYLFFANRTGNVDVMAEVGKMVVRADWWFTTPAVIVQPLSGFWLAHEAGWSLATPWLAASLALYLIAGVCWLPVVWLQIRLREMAAVAQQNGTPLPALYWRYARWWEGLGYPAFIAMLVVFWLMAVKPGF